MLAARGTSCSDSAAKAKKKPAHARAILAQLAPPSTGAFDYRILIT